MGSMIEVKILGRDSCEEIAKLSLTIREIEKAEICCEEKTILHLYGKDIYEATQQTLLFSNLTSYSIIDENDDNKIRLTFEQLSEENKTLVHEYFRRNAVYFKVLNNSTQREIYFRKLNLGKKS